MSPPLALDAAGSTPLANQVAGHQNVLSDASGSLVIKPALPREIAFYSLINSASRSSQLSKLKPFVAQFYGTLRLEGRLDGDGGVTREGVQTEVPESVVLENLSHLYTHPSILDVKLGTVLAAPDASEEKKQRMDKQAKSSTSWETGIRLTGCQTWHAPTSTYILTPKSYGKSITAADLSTGLARFFPLPSDSIPALVLPSSPPPTSTSTSPSVEAQISHLPLPPVPGDATPGTGSGSVKDYSSHAIPPKILLRLLKIVEDQLAQLEQVFQHLEARFTGSSILIVYEGDPERLESALDRYESRRARHALLSAEQPGEEEPDSDEDWDAASESDDSASTSSSDDEDDGTRADARRARRCPPLTLKLIDFAHTRLVEGEGPDEGVLKGLKTLRGLIKGRIEQVSAVA